jgi:hypothetical protein
LNAVLNALSDSYPSEAEMIETESREFDSLSAASGMRQCVKYPIGDGPAIFLNFGETPFGTSRRTRLTTVLSSVAPDPHAYI